MSKRKEISKKLPPLSSAAAHLPAVRKAGLQRNNSVPKQKAGPMQEIGTTGLLRTGNIGYVYEEYLRDLAGLRSRSVYREMRDNDNIIGAIFYAIEFVIRQVTWRVEGENKETADFVEGCLEDMSHTWDDFVAEVLSMLTFGWSYHEVIFKRRMGDTNDPATRSKFNDGKFGWRKFPIRGQESLIQWHWDDEGGVQGVTQCAPPFYNYQFIPIDRSLLFRIGLHKGNPEGRSLLRNIYRSWYFKRRVEEMEVIGVERDLAGLPIIYYDTRFEKQIDKLEEIVKNIRIDEQMGVVLPLAYDDKGNQLLKLELLGSPGSKQMNTSEILERIGRQMAMAVLADFIMLGNSGKGGGSFALAENKSELFGKGVAAILEAIASVINRHAIPKLLKLNAMPLDDAPQLKHDPIFPPALSELAALVTSLAQAGAPLFPDMKLENFFRIAGGMPEKTEEDAALATPLPDTKNPGDPKRTPAPKTKGDPSGKDGKAVASTEDQSADTLPEDGAE